MSLDDTVAHWLPGLLPYGNQITVNQLLSMTSGMVDTTDIVSNPAHYLGEIKDPAVRARLVALAQRMAKSANGISTQEWIALAAALPLSYTPGSTYHYSNIGYMVAGLIAQRAGGANLATLFRNLIIDPLHLTSARYDPAPQITGPHADGYFTYPNGTYKDLTAYTEGLAANGGIVSDAADEAHFLQALMRGQVLKPAQLAALETAYSSEPATSTVSASSYGLGVVNQYDGCADGLLVYGHNGGGDGYMSSVQVSPDGSRVAVVLINGYGASTAAQDNAGAVLFNTMQSFYCGG
jgi:D-alanyl-D-alanine carboxypeptidase